MAVNLYECMFLLDPTKMGTDGEEIRHQLHGVIEKFTGEVVVSRPWGADRARLAYPIEGTKKLHYFLVYLRAESTKINDMEKEYKLNEGIARLLFIKIDPKWEERMLEVARNESALGFQAFIDDSIEAMTEDLSPRRGRRSEMADAKD